MRTEQTPSTDGDHEMQKKALEKAKTKLPSPS